MELIGRRFGHIRVEHVVGKGGMGDVYAGYDEKLQRNVALKVLHMEQRLDAEARERLLREARALSKLDHPHICRIHDYIEQGDVDILVLEYIDGRTLLQAVDEGMSYGEKLRVAVAIAEVLVAAHRAGILHRDLKPDNVMLTADGQVKVLDFGLARLLRQMRDSQSIAPPIPIRSDVDEQWYAIDVAETTRRGFHGTAVGVTMGTPLYMSPEQARGEDLTTASDIYSFGLLLQALFTGLEPYAAELTPKEILLRASAGDSLRPEGLPRDLTSLIARLKQFAPSDRPTASDALERLRRIVEKPARVARQSVAATIALLMLIGGWRYMVDLRRERTEAQQARAQAEEALGEAARRRAQAEQLIDFTVGDLRNKLEPLGQLDILDAAAQRSLAYFASLEPRYLTVADLVRNAKALHQLGEVRIVQGKLDDAMRAFQQSVVLASAATKREPTDPEARLAEGTSHFWIGNTYRLRSDLPKALHHLTEYMKAGERLSRDYPKNDVYRLERGYGHSGVATILEMQGEYAKALEHYAVTRAIKAEQLAADPTSAQKQADLAMTLNKMGLALLRLGELRSAREHFETELQMCRTLVAAHPANVRLKEHLAISHSYVATVVEALGDYPRALALREAEVALDRELHARDANNAEWQRDLAVAQMRHGNLLRLHGRSAEALAQLDSAERLLVSLLARDPARRTWQRDLAIVRVARARALLVLGQQAAARQAVSEGIDALESLSSMDRFMPRYLADAYVVLGDIGAAQGSGAAAHDAWRRAFETLKPIAATATELDVLDVWARVLLRLEREADARPVIGRLERAGYVKHRQS